MARLLTFTAIAALTLGGVAAYAAGQGKGAMQGKGAQMQMPAFADIDADGDGRITREEVTAQRAAMMKERFDAADANDDGVVDAGEMEARMMERMQARMQDRIARMIAARDADGDGALSPDEMGPLSPAARMMMRADADGDGTVSQDEYKTAMQARKQRMGQRGRGMIGHHRMMGHHGMGMTDCMGRGAGMRN